MASQRALSQYWVPLVKEQNTLWLGPLDSSPQSYRKQSFQPPPDVLLPAQPARLLCCFIHGLFPSFGSLTQGLGGLGLLPQLRERLRCSLRIQLWQRYLWTQPCPALGGTSQELVSWGVRVGIKVLGDQHGSSGPESPTQLCTVTPGSPEDQSLLKIRENMMVRS